MLIIERILIGVGTVWDVVGVLAAGCSDQGGLREGDHCCVGSCFVAWGWLLQ